MAWAIKSGWGYEVGEIVKRSAKMLVVKRGGRDNHWRLDEVLLELPDEMAARNVCEKMQSSRALMNEDQRKASDRHAERIAKIIAAHSPSAKEMED